MRRALLAVAAILAANVYTGPIPGDVRNNKFSFSHTSDWKSNQIINTVQNDHTDALVVTWLDGGIFAPAERPIPAGKSDSNTSFCPEDALGKNLLAKLFYGLSRTEKVAGVYRIMQSVKTTDAIQSEIVANTRTAPIRLQVASRAVPNEFVEYTFEQSTPIYFALRMPSGFLAAFEKAGVPASPNAFGTLKAGEPPIREQLANSEAYALFKPFKRQSVVRIPTTSFQIRRTLLFIADTDMRVIASGFVTLHVPAP